LPFIASQPDFLNLLRANENKMLEFVIYNMFTQKERKLNITLNRQ